MRNTPVLRGQKILLRPVRQSDIKERFEAGRRWQTEYTRAIAGDLTPIYEFTREKAESWLATRSDSIKWAIEADGRLIGGIRLEEIEELDLNASIAIGIFSPDDWGHGFGSEAIKLVLGHAFSDLDMHRIWLKVMESNVRAIKSYKKCGFVVEGRLRDSVRTSSGWEADLVMGVLPNEYERITENRI